MRKPKRGGRQAPPKEKYRINERITAREVRVIDEDGQMMGVYPPQDALRLAQDRNLDLIEIAPNANPPTCKMMDYGKWKYENKKKAQIAKKKQTVISVKEIQIRPRTDDHDLETKLKNARKFLLAGDKVKVNLRYQGREMAHKEVGAKVLQRVMQKLSEIAVAEVEPKMEGRQLFVVMAPDATKIKEYQSKKDKPAEEAASTEA
ncbi:MAG: translation initiation factor IF-3 [Bdellovibrionales bacterium]|nr:translation initiation factor IF-3 [Bdellovibrionales bacterium]